MLEALDALESLQHKRGHALIITEAIHFWDSHVKSSVWVEPPWHGKPWEILTLGHDGLNGHHGHHGLA